jgi:uncharacterized membrane protein (UPF0127 family)
MPDPPGAGGSGPGRGISNATLVRALARATRGWLIAAGVLVVVVGGVALGANRPSDPVVLPPPLTGPGSPGDLTYAQGRVQLGTRCLTVLVADTDAKREHGLMGQPTVPLDGMLFVYDHTVHFDFTMSHTLVPLDAGFYDGRGRRVDELHMVPCPKVASACVRYHSRHAYRYVLETAHGQLGAGSLGACPA